MFLSEEEYIAIFNVNKKYTDAQIEKIKKDGVEGINGKSPYIGSNGNWFEYDDETQSYVDTNKKAQGQNANINTVVTIIDGYWALDGVKTPIKAQGEDGKSPEFELDEDGNLYATYED